MRFLTLQVGKNILTKLSIPIPHDNRSMTLTIDFTLLEDAINYEHAILLEEGRIILEEHFDKHIPAFKVEG